MRLNSLPEDSEVTDVVPIGQWGGNNAVAPSLLSCRSRATFHELWAHVRKLPPRVRMK